MAMEFCLPYLYDPANSIPPIEVPYVAQYPYDVLLPNLFEHFAHECGFENYDRPLEELAALMQSWLFFGLISEICARSIEHEVFIRIRHHEGKDKLFIDARLDKCLDSLIEDRIKVISKSPDRLRTHILLNIKQHIDSAQRKALVFEKIQAGKNTSLPLVALLVQNLLQFLELKFRPRGRSAPMESYQLAQNFDSTPLSTGVLIDRLRSQGWCPHRIHNTCYSLSYAALYYLSSLKSQLASRSLHSNCESSGCVAVTGQHFASHRSEDCTCFAKASSHPDIQIVKDLIKLGEIPLIEAKINSESGDLELNVVRATPYSRYTAVSHVWSDCQLGSESNSLPRCQLQHLVSRVKSNNVNFGSGYWLFDKLCSKALEVAWHCNLLQHRCHGKNLFWLDTLCIPSDDFELRLKALGTMDLVYSNANEVLVLDRELQTVECEGTPTPVVGEGIIHPCYQMYLGPSDSCFMQTLAYVFSSNWMGRAWTLQEAVLARRCVIQLQDGVFDTHILQPPACCKKELRRKFIGTSSMRHLAKPWIWFRARHDPTQKRTKELAQGKFGSIVLCINAVLQTVFRYIILFILQIHGLDFEDRYAQVKDRLYSPMQQARSIDVRGHVQYEFANQIRESLQLPMKLDAHATYMYYVSHSAQRFTIIWNALVGRVTTKEEDLHVILANLLGFNAGVMMRSYVGPQDRMHAIITALDELPLDLLFLDAESELSSHPTTAPTTAPTTERAYWIPSYPGKGRLELRSKMVRVESGYLLHFELESVGSILACAAQGIDRSTRTFQLTSYVAHAVVEGFSDHEQRYLVEDLETTGQISQRPEIGENEIYIIFHDSPNLICKGARFNVLRTEAHKIILEYDCAVRVSKSKDATVRLSLPASRARAKPFDSDLILDYKHHATPHLQQRTMNHKHIQDVRVDVIAEWIGIGAFLSILAIVIFLGIVLVEPPLRTLEVGSIVPLVLFIVFAHGTAFYWFRIPYDITQYVFRVKLHKRWAATFREDWKVGNTVEADWITAVAFSGVADFLDKQFSTVCDMSLALIVLPFIFVYKFFRWERPLE